QLEAFAVERLDARDAHVERVAARTERRAGAESASDHRCREGQPKRQRPRHGERASQRSTHLRSLLIQWWTDSARSSGDRRAAPRTSRATSRHKRLTPRHRPIALEASPPAQTRIMPMSQSGRFEYQNAKSRLGKPL